MELDVINLGKRFNKRNWVFKNLHITFTEVSHAILGDNGIGKSTLLKTLIGIQKPTQGKVHFKINNIVASSKHIYKNSIYLSPLTNMIEELSLKEFYKLLFSLRILEVSLDRLISIIDMSFTRRNNLISTMSYGNKQKLKLGVALVSNATIILLDEPTLGMDIKNIRWYQKKFASLEKKILIIASNDIRDFYFCRKKTNLSKFIESILNIKNKFIKLTFYKLTCNMKRISKLGFYALSISIVMILCQACPTDDPTDDSTTPGAVLDTFSATLTVTNAIQDVGGNEDDITSTLENFSLEISTKSSTEDGTTTLSDRRYTVENPDAAVSFVSSNTGTWSALVDGTDVSVIFGDSDTVAVTAFAPGNSLTANGLVAEVSSLTVEFEKSPAPNKPKVKYRFELAK